MKRYVPIILGLVFLSILSGWLLSKASLIGRVGISLFYKEYAFLKTWWQGAILVFGVLLVLLIIQGIIEQKATKSTAKIVHLALVLIALAGLYFTYSDFRHSTSHRWLGERFHLGAYLFWLGWIIVSLFYLFTRKKEPLLPPAAPTETTGTGQVDI